MKKKPSKTSKRPSKSKPRRKLPGYFTDFVRAQKLAIWKLVRVEVQREIRKAMEFVRETPEDMQASLERIAQGMEQAEPLANEAADIATLQGLQDRGDARKKAFRLRNARELPELMEFWAAQIGNGKIDAETIQNILRNSAPQLRELFQDLGQIPNVRVVKEADNEMAVKKIKLADVLDDELTERMLLQHDRYEFGDYAVAKHSTTGLWYVYYRGIEMHIRMGIKATDGFLHLADALEFCLSPRNQEIVEENYKP